MTLSDTIKHVGERYYIEATATLYDVEPTPDIGISLCKRKRNKKGMDSSQITGAAFTLGVKIRLERTV